MLKAPWSCSELTIEITINVVQCHVSSLVCSVLLRMGCESKLSDLRKLLAFDMC